MQSGEGSVLRRSRRLASLQDGPASDQPLTSPRSARRNTPAAKRPKTQPLEHNINVANASIDTQPKTTRKGTRSAKEGTEKAVSATKSKGRAAKAEKGPTGAPEEPTEGPAAELPPIKRNATKTPSGFGAYEHQLWKEGHIRLVGVDEAGRGPLAGPVVAAACSVPPGWSLPGVADSKSLKAAQRDELYDAIMACPDVTVTTSIVEAAQIDEMNILRASLHAMQQCVNQMPDNAQGHVLVDGPYLPPDMDPSQGSAVIKGDSSCISIAAASIVAKVVRDRLMDELHEQYPQYNFAQHKGYPTAAHRAALQTHGPCPQHRRSYAPVQAALKASQHKDD